MLAGCRYGLAVRYLGEFSCTILSNSWSNSWISGAGGLVVYVIVLGDGNVSRVRGVVGSHGEVVNALDAEAAAAFRHEAALVIVAVASVAGLPAGELGGAIAFGSASGGFFGGRRGGIGGMLLDVVGWAGLGVHWVMMALSWVWVKCEFATFLLHSVGVAIRVPLDGITKTKRKTNGTHYEKCHHRRD